MPPQTEKRPPEDIPADGDAQSRDTSGNNETVGASSDWSTSVPLTVVQESDSLAELFGYVEHSESNTMALVRRVRTFPLTSSLCD